MRIIAFDPGYGRTGWGVVEAGQRANEFRALGYGVMETEPALSQSLRLYSLSEQCTRLLAEYDPDHAVMETLYFSQNQTTAAGVYQAQGALLACVGQRGLPLLELSPSTIKSVIAGSGRAGKLEVGRMVERLLGIPGPIRPDDAADALAGAIAGLFHVRSGAVLAAARPGV